jgi:hypothetical protein
MAQGLRPSQYITTFGPAALIETPSGPHILCGTEDVLRRIHAGSIDMEQLSIRDIRLQRGLLQGDRIFKLPDSQGWPNFTYPTRKFPTWNLCIQHQEFNVIHKGSDGCPECKTEQSRRESRKSKYAIRFLVACPNGHLDDVNWPSLVHSGRDGSEQATRCNGQHFRWVGAGSSLSAIRIVCPACGAHKELGEIYSYRLRCRGRRPERSAGAYEPCPTDQAIVVQRGSFQIRLPEVVTSLTIPPLVSSIHRVLQREDIMGIVATLKDIDNFNEGTFWKALAGATERKKVPAQVEAELKAYTWKDLEEAIQHIEMASAPRSRSEYLEQEHNSLMDVVDTGYPPYPHDNERRIGEPISFQVDASAIRRSVLGPSGKLSFRVMPLERLRVVMAQIGFRRVNFTGPDSRLTSARGSHPLNTEQFWVPGVEQFGEGIYLDLDPSVAGQRDWYPKGAAAEKWDATIPGVPAGNNLVLWNALSVWWHSLSHRLINALSLHSGYSSTAIRERVYLSTSKEGDVRGGVLLYTTQPGGDGTMGGLTSLAPDFEHILDLSMRGIDRCSNDPLCENAEIDSVSKLGAACYSCEMVSETSCEHYNGYLHRGIVLENQP